MRKNKKEYQPILGTRGKQSRKEVINMIKEAELVSKATEKVKREAKEKIMKGNLDAKEMDKVVEEATNKIDELERKGSHNMLYQQIVLLAELSQETGDVDDLVELTNAIVKAYTALSNY